MDVGQDVVPITITIVDDNDNPVVEGNETFHLMFEDPKDVEIRQPEKLKVVINDNNLDRMFCCYYNIS